MGVTARDVCNTLLLLNAGVLIGPITSHRKREFLWTLERARKEKVKTLVATVTLIRSLSLEPRLDRGGRGCQSSCCRPVQHLFGPQHLLIAHTDEEHLMAFISGAFFFFSEGDKWKNKKWNLYVWLCTTGQNSRGSWILTGHLQLWAQSTQEVSYPFQSSSFLLLLCYWTHFKTLIIVSITGKGAAWKIKTYVFTTFALHFSFSVSHKPTFSHSSLSFSLSPPLCGVTWCSFISAERL